MARTKNGRDLGWHLSTAERYAAGKALRKACPRESHAAWKAPAGRKDPVEMVLAAEKGRMPELLPLRHGRMARSAFTFYRGSALPMAADLASTPVIRESASSAAGTRISPTSADSPRRSGGSSSPSTTSTRRSRPRGSGTSSDSPRASSWHAGTTG